MKHFMTRYHITPEIYNDLKIKVLTGKYVQAVKEFKDLAGISLMDSRAALLSEFKLEYKLSSDMTLYACIQRIEAYEGINNLPVASDLGVLLEFARNQLCQGLNSNNQGQICQK
jgi:hypothetical protein